MATTFKASPAMPTSPSFPGVDQAFEAGKTKRPSHDSHDSHDDETDTATASIKQNGKSHIANKPSTPLAAPFLVSAPGKVIVFGEHAVVHGKAAIAASISLRSYLHVTTLSASRRTITLRFRDIELDHTWKIDELPWGVFGGLAHKRGSHKNGSATALDDGEDARRGQVPSTSVDPECVKAMQPHIDSVSTDLPAKQRKIHQGAATTFLYLYLCLADPSTAVGCIYTLRSTIPIGAGLGSSASISVCLATALLLQSKTVTSPETAQTSSSTPTPISPALLARQEIDLINHWAFLGEVLIHGNPSGVDNTVSTQGKAVLFKRTDYGKPPSVTTLSSFPELPLLLIDTREPKSTAAQVAKVAGLKARQPEITAGILDAIDRITEAAHEIISSASESSSVSDGFDASRPEHVARLGELVALNHGLLYTLGVSHPRLERLKALVDASGVGWTKLTGSGGGGCAFAILSPADAPVGASTHYEASSQRHQSATSTADKTRHNGNGEGNGDDQQQSRSRSSRLAELEVALKREGFVQFETTLGGPGVGVLMPAIVDDDGDATIPSSNGNSSVDQVKQGCRVIDQEAFCAADGPDGLERLVGAKRDWAFWSLA